LSPYAVNNSTRRISQLGAHPTAVVITCLSRGESQPEDDALGPFGRAGVAPGLHPCSARRAPAPSGESLRNEPRGTLLRLGGLTKGHALARRGATVVPVARQSTLTDRLVLSGASRSSSEFESLPPSQSRRNSPSSAIAARCGVRFRCSVRGLRQISRGMSPQPYAISTAWLESSEFESQAGVAPRSGVVGFSAPNRSLIRGDIQPPMILIV
jgi:hypothetical protein